ncbi:hypothetical protein NQD34_013344 [Periophthalmus magnuspinnatus]|nr:hypothetical protein NQD34_013344 [Periophthalmus magnuspinnatus]
MLLQALIFVFGLFFSAEQLWTSAHDAHSPAGGRVVQLQMEVDAPDAKNLSLGGSVLITCSVDRVQDQDRSETRLRLVHTILGAIQVLASGSSSSGPLSVRLSPVTLEHRGLYSCEGHGPDQNQDIMVESDHRLIWVQDPSPVVTLQLSRVQRVNFFHGKTLTVSCALPAGGAEWRILSASEKEGSISECPQQERSGDLLSCSVASSFFPLKTRLYNLFWCESSTGLRSNVLNLTDAEIKDQNSRPLMVTRFEVAPAWSLRTGDSVTFSCEVRTDKYNNSQNCNLQLIHTHMDSRNMTVVLSQPATRPINYTIDSVSREHQGVWTCWDDGTLSLLSLPWHTFLLVEDDSAPVAKVTIDVLNYNRTQFFHDELMTVGCRLPEGEYDVWRIMKVCLYAFRPGLVLVWS